MAGTVQFFQFNRKLYQAVGIQPLSSQNSLFASYNWRNLTALVSFLIMFAASTAYFLYGANSFQEYGDSYYLSATLLMNIVCLPTIIPKMTDAFVLMDKFGEIVENLAENDPSSKDKYSKMNEKIERITSRFYAFIMISQNAGMVVASFLPTAIDYFINNLGDESYHFLHPTLWPFDCKTPIGFLIVFVIDCVANVCTQTWLIPTVWFFVGLCWLSIAFAKDIASDLNFLNIGGASEDCHVKLIQRFCEIVQIYADARQLRRLITPLIQYQKISISIRFSALLMNLIEFLECGRLRSFCGSSLVCAFHYYKFKLN